MSERTRFPPGPSSPVTTPFSIPARRRIFWEPLIRFASCGDCNFSILAVSDFLANTGVHYLNPSARGLEAGDSVSISGPNQITFDTRASSPSDYVRVLTEFSPRAKRITSGARKYARMKRSS